MDKNEKAVVLKGESIRRTCRKFSLKDIKVTMVAAATIIVAAGGFTTYAIAKDAKEKAVIARIDNNNVESQAKFNADVLYEYEKMKEQNIKDFEHFVENSMMLSPMRVLTNYDMDYSENTDGPIESKFMARYKTYSLEFVTNFMYSIEDIEKIRKGDSIYIYLDKEKLDVQTGLMNSYDKDTLDKNGKVKSGWITNNDKVNAHNVEVEKGKTKLLIHNAAVKEYSDEAINSIAKYIESIAQSFNVEIEIITGGVAEALMKTQDGEAVITKEDNIKLSEGASKIISEEEYNNIDKNEK